MDQGLIKAIKNSFTFHNVSIKSRRYIDYYTPK